MGIEISSTGGPRTNRLSQSLLLFGLYQSEKLSFHRETRIEETSLFTFLAISSPTLSVATSSNGPLHVEYNIRSLMEHLYPGIEYTNTARQHNHVDGGAAYGQR